MKIYKSKFFLIVLLIIFISTTLSHATQKSTLKPTLRPTLKPALKPTLKPRQTLKPIVKPTVKQTQKPTQKPTEKPTLNNIDINFNVKYYAIRTDDRECEHPMCGGYFLKELNSNNTSEVYVSTLVQNSLPIVREDQYRNIRNYEIIVYGTIISSGSITFEAKIIASRIYRYIDNLQNDYGLQNGDDFNFYNIIGYNTKLVGELNTNNNIVLGNLVNNYTDSIPFIQKDWLFYKVMSNNALFTSPSIFKDYQTITIDHMFIGLPDPVCSGNLLEINCENNTVATYTRLINRCKWFSGCETMGPCPQYIPECADGYKLTSTTSKPQGCQKYYCDPDFL